MDALFMNGKVMNKYIISNNQNSDSFDQIKIGILIAGGSGILLSKIFKDFFIFFINECCKETLNKNVVLYFNDEFKNVSDKPTDKTFSSYTLLKSRAKELIKILEKPSIGSRMKKLSNLEAKDLESLYRYWNQEGVDIVFRTSVNAEALYTFRQAVFSIKEILITQQQFLNFGEEKKKSKVLMIRDQVQGFYTNDKYEFDNEFSPTEIRYEGHFSKEKFKKIIKFANERGRERLSENFEIWMSYKFHLFGNVMEQWIKDIELELKLDKPIKMYQPDTGFTELFSFLRSKDDKDLLFIAGNEIGDLMYEPTIEILKSTGSKLELYSKSFMLDLPNIPPNNGYMCELQTVHGSADDLILAGEEEKILPYATLRVVSSIIETKLEIENFTRIMDKAVAKVQLQAKLEVIKNDRVLGCTQIVSAIQNEIRNTYTT